MPTDRPDQCQTCRFWSNINPGENDGRCRRFPPLAWEGVDSIWLETDPDDWCGEWKAKPLTALDEIVTGPRAAFTAPSRKFLAKWGVPRPPTSMNTPPTL